jgi:hypothetical protein
MEDRQTKTAWQTKSMKIGAKNVRQSSWTVHSLSASLAVATMVVATMVVVTLEVVMMEVGQTG